MSPSHECGPSPGERKDAVVKTLAEGGVLLAMTAVHLAMDLPVSALLLAVAVLLAGSLMADVYLFGSLGRAFAARRALHFKVSPFLVAAVLLFFLLPAENDGDKIVRFALAAGMGGVVTGLLNLERRSTTRA